MAHPHHEHKDHKVQKRRVAHITKHYAHGGAVHEDEAEDKKLIKRTVKKKALKMEGGKPKHRMDRRARGGRTKSKGKGTNVNVIVAPQHAAGGAPGMMPGMPPGAMPPPHPPMMASPSPPGAPPPMPPGGMPPPGMPPRPGMMPPPGMMPHKRGGRAYAKGGAVKDGAAYEEGIKNGTPVQHSDGKMDGKDIGRGRVVTFWAGGGVKKRATGGKIEAPEGVAPATKMPGGGGGAKARLFKEKRAEKDYAKA